MFRVLPEPYSDDLELGEEAQYLIELLERMVVDDVLTKVVDGCTGVDGLELLQHVKAGGDIVEPSSWHGGGVR
jgi:hypothetical protein